MSSLPINNTQYLHTKRTNFVGSKDAAAQNNSVFGTSPFAQTENENSFVTFEPSAEANIADRETSELRKNLEETKSKQGFIGKLWDGFKNLTGIGAGSSKAEKAITDYENGKISKEEMEKAVNGYTEGQKMVVDVVADIASGILAMGAFALAVPTGGASLAVGLGLATAVGAGSKVLIKGGDALLTGKEYSGKDLLYDTATGSINGLLAPVTNGIGNTVTKTIGTKLGLTVVKEGAEEVVEQGVKQGIKSIVLNQTADVVGGTVAKRAIALGAGMAVDGALGGASDNMVRAALNGENVLEAGVQGAVGGLVMAPLIGGGFRVAGKAGRALNNKITTNKVLPDGVSTKFKQGTTGDCALLSTIDGMMANPNTASQIKKSITKTLGGDYNVKIGDKVIKVAKSSLTDEMLSDTTGIRIFEQAYKQAGGSIDGEFAEVVAKQFGLNPVHITSDSITDEVLDNLAKNQNDAVLSLGAMIDADGAITNTNGSRHYFTIKDIDANSKTVTLTNPADTSQTIKLTYNEVKNMGISIDGGTTKAMDLPSSVRSGDENVFYGNDYGRKIIYDTEQEMVLKPWDYENSTAKITNFEDEKMLVVNGQEISLGKYRKAFKKLKNNPDECLEINLNKEECLLVYGDGRVINGTNSDLTIKLCQKTETFVLEDISVIREKASPINFDSEILTREEMLSDLAKNVDYNLYFQLEKLSDNDLAVFYNSQVDPTPAIEGYKSDKKVFESIQKALDNGGINTDKKTIQTINSISESIEKKILPDGTDLYRGTGYAEFGDIGLKMQEIDGITDPVLKTVAIEKFLNEYGSSEHSLTYPRFMSTNIGDCAGSFYGSKPVILKLTTKDDTRGISLICDSVYNKKELEILLQRNSSIKYYISYDFDNKKWLVIGTVTN